MTNNRTVRLVRRFLRVAMGLHSARLQGMTTSLCKSVTSDAGPAYLSPPWSPAELLVNLELPSMLTSDKSA